MLKAIHNDVRERSDPNRWCRNLPTVRVKAKYMHCLSPVAKHEHGCKRATWPNDCVEDLVGLKDFDHWVRDKLNKHEAQANKLILGARRVMGMLEVEPMSLWISDPLVLVALFRSKQHRELLRSPLLDPKYYWTEGCLVGLVNYVGCVGFVHVCCELHPNMMSSTCLEVVIHLFAHNGYQTASSVWGGLRYT
jgi:hypothetical protein